MWGWVILKNFIQFKYKKKQN
uniref:Uncharacterized protein n=1 Tax=Lepeophtheirus salmonis TaxID=72036 RepID=A0A0K2UWG8_LEPSM